MNVLTCTNLKPISKVLFNLISLFLFYFLGFFAEVQLLVNGVKKASFYDVESNGNSRQMTGTSVVDVKEDDVVKITNERSSTLYVSDPRPITLIASYVSS